MVKKKKKVNRRCPKEIHFCTQVEMRVFNVVFFVMAKN